MALVVLLIHKKFEVQEWSGKKLTATDEVSHNYPTYSIAISEGFLAFGLRRCAHHRP